MARTLAEDWRRSRKTRITRDGKAEPYRMAERQSRQQILIEILSCIGLVRALLHSDAAKPPPTQGESNKVW
jgi:hypothetical protein